MAADTPQVITYLRSLDAVHDRCQQVFELAENGQVDHWVYSPEKLGDVVDYCVKLIQRDYKDLSKVSPPQRSSFNADSSGPS